jgi:hypothetical protein
MEKWCLCLAVLAVLSPFAFSQTKESPGTALERRGFYHATVEGRFVSSDNTPVPGVHVQLSAGRPRALPLVDVITGADGRFIIRDVNSSYMADLRWYPPEQWMRGGIAIGGESGSLGDVGTIKLQQNTVVRVAVELVGGPTLDARDIRPGVLLSEKSEYGLRLSAEEVGPHSVFRQVPFDEGTWEISLFTRSRIERYTAPFRVQQGSRDRLFRIRVLRDTLKMENRYGGTGNLDIREEMLAPEALEREFRARGRVLAPDRSPIPGAVVGLAPFFPREAMPQWTVTDKDGTFDFKYVALHCMDIAVSYGDSDYIRHEKPTGVTEPCESWWSRPQDLVIAQATSLAIAVDGVGPASVRASWWHDSFGWTEFSSLRPWVSLTAFQTYILKLDSPGLLPIARTVELPFVPLGMKAPAQVTERFRFDSAGSRQLTVRANGQPLSETIVDVEKVEDLVKNHRIRLATYKTSATGELRLAGGSDQLVEVFAYAEGYEPQRAIWIPGVPLALDLIPRSATVSFGPRSGAALVRIRPVGNPEAVRTLNLEAKTQMAIPPGEYDVTSYTDQGTVLGYQRLAIGAAEAKVIDPTVDQRPRLTLRFPAAGWQSQISESTPRGGAVNWAAMIAVVGTLELHDVPATKVASSPQADVYLLSRAGRMQVDVQRENSPIFWREITASPGESLIIDVPSETATLEMPSNFDPGKGHTHGIAGPRLQLIADDPSRWSITGFIPMKRGGTFVLRDVPPGDYRLYHHLFNGKITDSFGGKTYTYTGTPAVWGGVAVRLTAGKTTRIGSLNTKFGNLNVRLMDSAGRPINNATIRIRDRMSDSWRQVDENPAQLEQAGLPIPYPAAVRIIDGKATLPQIRSGWLEFVVENDEGSSYSYTMGVSPGQELRVTVPR